MSVMAGSHSPVFTFFPNPSSRTACGSRRATLFIALAIPTISQLNVGPTTRKNHLRSKILKTLIKPYPPISPLVPDEYSTVPNYPISSSNAPQEVTELLPGGTSDSSVGKVEKFEELYVSESLENSDDTHDGTVGEREIFEELQVSESFGNVWAPEGFVEADSEKKAGDMGRKKREGEILSNGNGKPLRVNLRSDKNNMICVSDLSQMEKKIEEIKLMAREARIIERKKKEDAGDSGMDDIGTDSSHTIGIQKEISARLGKLEKKMNLTKGRLPRPNVNPLESSVTEKDAKDENGLLMLKKKSKLASPSTKAAKSSKGFPVIMYTEASPPEKSPLGKDKVQLRVDGMEENNHKAPLRSENSLNHELRELENNIKTQNLEAERRAEETKVTIGKQNSQAFEERNQEAVFTSRGDAASSMNGTPQHGPRMGQNMLSEDKVTAQKVNIQTVFWWSSLPYVLVILVQRRSECSSGFYTVKNTSNQELDQTDLSYIVAFEDRVEADNFCFLLESAFQDLGDFSADVITISNQELHDAIRLDGIKVVVVKKRQIQLYAGQPLAEVEKALCSLIRSECL